MGDPYDQAGFHFLLERVRGALADVHGCDAGQVRGDKPSGVHQFTLALWEQLPWQVGRALNVVAQQMGYDE